MTSSPGLSRGGEAVGLGDRISSGGAGERVPLLWGVFPSRLLTWAGLISNLSDSSTLSGKEGIP